MLVTTPTEKRDDGRPYNFGDQHVASMTGSIANLNANGPLQMSVQMSDFGFRNGTHGYIPQYGTERVFLITLTEKRDSGQLYNFDDQHVASITSSISNLATQFVRHRPQWPSFDVRPTVHCITSLSSPHTVRSTSVPFAKFRSSSDVSLLLLLGTDCASVTALTERGDRGRPRNFVDRHVSSRPSPSSNSATQFVRRLAISREKTTPHRTRVSDRRTCISNARISETDVPTILASESTPSDFSRCA